MPKIVVVNDKTVAIGFEDGSLREIPRANFAENTGFEPSVGDQVEVFENATSIVVSKIESVPPVPQAAPTPTPSGGRLLIDPTSPYSPGHPTAPAYVAPVGGNVVNKVAYGIMAILLGGLGVHKFYAGKVGMGILYLIFCWTYIPAIAGLIEGIIALTKPADAAGNIVV